MAYGIIIACLSLFGMLVLAIAAVRMESEPDVAQPTEREADREVKKAA